MEFRKDINGLRAVAVILVLLFHFHTPGFGAGYLGVDVFFVISGFLMTGIILRGIDGGGFSIMRFYRARLARLYPALLAVVAATLLFGLVFVEPVALAQIARHGISALLFLSNVLFWKESGYFGAPAEAMWLLHTWSLSVEWQFYLLYPIVLLLAAPLIRGRGARFALLFGGFAASLAVSVASAELVSSERLVSFGFYMLPTRAWEMLAGGLIALRPDLLAAASQRMRTALEAIGLGAILLGLVLFSEATPWPSYHALLPVAGTMLVLAANPHRSLMAVPPLQHIGAWSYSVYLWHWPILAALAYFAIDGAASLVAAFALSLAAGWLSFRFVEGPARDWLNRPAAHRLPAAPRFPAMGALTATAAGVIALETLVVAGNGLPQRSPSMVPVFHETLAAAADYTYPLERCGGLGTFGGALRPCVVGTPSERDDVLVLGDSFAEMWFPRVAALESRLRDYAVVFVTKGGCPPITGLERLAPGLGCRHFHDVAMQEARDPRYRTIIMAGMWASYFTSEKPNSVICGAGGCSSSASAEGLQAATASLVGVVDELQRLGKNVVFLTTSPYPGFDVASELRKRLFAGHEVPSGWSFDFDQVLSRSLPIDRAIASLRERGAEVVDLPGILCAGGQCPALREMIPLYTDSDHLRSSYTASAGAFLDRFILPWEAAQAEAAPVN